MQAELIKKLYFLVSLQSNQRYNNVKGIANDQLF